MTLSGTAARLPRRWRARELHRQLQLLRPRQPGGDHDRHGQQRHNRTADGGHHARRYDDGVGCAACLAERQREHGDLAERANAITVSDTPNTGDVLHTTLTVSHGTITVGTLDGTTSSAASTAAAR